VPKDLAFTLSEYAASFALDLTYLLTYQYTTHAYYNEMWNMTLGMNRTDLYPMARRIHMIGELTKGHCSMFGVNIFIYIFLKYKKKKKFLYLIK
jgi:hypothetical protein